MKAPDAFKYDVVHTILQSVLPYDTSLRHLHKIIAQALLAAISQPPQGQPIQPRYIPPIQRLRRAFPLAAEAALEAVDAPQPVMARFESGFQRRLVHVGDAPQVVFAAAAGLGPFYRFPLQQIGWHPVALFVVRSAVEIP